MSAPATDSPRARVLAASGLLAAILPALLAAAPPSAEAAPARTLRIDTILVATNALEEASLGFVEAVSERSDADLESLFVPDGIRLQIDGPARRGISSRQVAVSLRGFFREFDDERAFLNRATPVDGAPDRGFAEVLWSGRAAGTSDEVERTFFLGLFRSGGGWRIDELRVLAR